VEDSGFEVPLRSQNAAAIYCLPSVSSAFHGPLAKNYSLYVIEYLDFTEAESARQIPCFRAFRAASFTNLKHGVNET